MWKEIFFLREKYIYSKTKQKKTHLAILIQEENEILLFCFHIVFSFFFFFFFDYPILLCSRHTTLRILSKNLGLLFITIDNISEGKERLGAKK